MSHQSEKGLGEQGMAQTKACQIETAADDSRSSFSDDKSLGLPQSCAQD